MNISTFDDLLQAARQQSEPQRLLLVFAGASLPADATPAQKAAFEAGESGELAPLMCVDKAPQDLADFAALVAEAATLGPPWALVFATALAGRGAVPPTAKEIDAGLTLAVEAVRSGELARFIPFDREGHAVQLG